MKIKKECPICGKEFFTWSSKIKIGRGKYCSKECSQEVTNNILKKNGENSRFIKGKKHEWHSHRNKMANGYIEIYRPDHPNATSRGYVREHRLVMEDKIGRFLEEHEDVHHINEVKDDNRIENLELITHSDHTKMNNPVIKRWKKRKEGDAQ